MIGPQDIQVLFGDLLDQIQDRDLAAKVIAAWVDACDRGGWRTLEQLAEMPYTLLADTMGISFPEHVSAVTYGAMGLAQAQLKYFKVVPYEIDLDALIAGGILHDLGKLVEIEPNGQGGYRKSHNGRCMRHPISGTVIAAQHGLPPGILNMIANHASEGVGQPQRVETVLIHQADYATFNPMVMKSKGQLITERDA
ncbi:MAG: HD domain-containing protein [Deltaproteobacteria bacterium]|nr:HD domain-containing protein [Deltaproteobacteria bacterium]